MNYSEMTNESLNRLSANICGFNWIDKLHVIDNDGNSIVDGSQWYPTHPDSNQAERYLFAKLQDWKVIPHYVDINHNRQIFSGQLVYRTRIYKKYKLIANVDTFEAEHANRTKVIAALIAWRKLNETS